MTPEKRIKVEQVLDLVMQNYVGLKDLADRIAELPFYHGTPTMKRILAAFEEPIKKNWWRVF